MRLLPVLQALRFNQRNTSALKGIPRPEWPGLLRMTDQEGLTLPLGIRCSGLLPPLVESRIQHNLENNTQRYSRLVDAYAGIAGALHSQALPFAVLKGLSKSQYYAADLRHRPQYDIDVYVPAEALSSARGAIEALGYEALPDGHSRDADHLPRMIRRTGWRWREDYFDPEMPTAVELHFQFWNKRTEGFSTGDLTPFWTRRVVRDVGGMRLPALTPVDALSYSTLHLLRHLFRGDLHFHHVYEMAHFLDGSAADDTFWGEWCSSALPSCRIVEAIAFRLAAEWFHCSLHPAPRRAIEQLPHLVDRWFDLFGTSPSLIAGRPNKNELLLHLCLIPESRDRRKIVVSRLFPLHRGRVVLDAHTPRARVSRARHLRGFGFECRFLLKRAGYHAVTLASILLSGLRWWIDAPAAKRIPRSAPARTSLP